MATMTRGTLESKVVVQETHVGKGVFARRKFKTDSIIGELTGDLIRDPEYTSSYCVDMGDDVALEPEPPLRFLNHSCDPNCELFVYDDDLFRLYLVTLRPIQAGEELTIDYGWPADVAIPCLCGSKHCRGWVVDPEDLPEVLEREATKAAQVAASTSETNGKPAANGRAKGKGRSNSGSKKSDGQAAGGRSKRAATC